MKREFDGVKINVEFEETKNRQQLTSGDSANTLIGKISKWLKDLKAICFSGSFSDLTDIPTKSGIYKVTVDENGKATFVEPVTKDDVINLGVVSEYEFQVTDGSLYYNPVESGTGE